MIAEQNALRDLLCLLILIYTIVLFARVILSFATLAGFRPPMSGPVRSAFDLLDDVTEPVLRPFRRLIPPVRAGGIGLDFSILIVFVILTVLRSAICS